MYVKQNIAPGYRTLGDPMLLAGCMENSVNSNTVMTMPGYFLLRSVVAEGHNRVNICCLPGGIQTKENAD